VVLSYQTWAASYNLTCRKQEKLKPALGCTGKERSRGREGLLPGNGMVLLQVVLLRESAEFDCHLEELGETTEIVSVKFRGRVTHVMLAIALMK
jgi:hypothetical protein